MATPGGGQGTALASSTSSSSLDSDDNASSIFRKHQAHVPHLPVAIHARTLVANNTWGVLSTLSRDSSTAGFPSGSVVEYASDERGCPLLALSALSPHTGDLARDDRASLTIPTAGSKGLADARVTLIGRIRRLEGEESEAAQVAYLARHPGSYWVGFGDFGMYAMHSVLGARLVGGFARAGKVDGLEYSAAAPDAISVFAPPICKHMNEDHADACAVMVRHYASFPAVGAIMTGVDTLGMDLLATTQDGEEERVRLAYLTLATDRKSVKDRIVEMTRAAMAAERAEKAAAAATAAAAQ